MLQRAARTNIARRSMGVILRSSRGRNPLLGGRYPIKPTNATRGRFTISMRPSVIGAPSYHGNVTSCPLANKTVCADLTENVCKRAGLEEGCRECPQSILSGMCPVCTPSHSHPSPWVFPKCRFWRWLKRLFCCTFVSVDSKPIKIARKLCTIGGF